MDWKPDSLGQQWTFGLYWAIMNWKTDSYGQEWTVGLFWAMMDGKPDSLLPLVLPVVSFFPLQELPTAADSTGQKYVRCNLKETAWSSNCQIYYRATGLMSSACALVSERHVLVVNLCCTWLDFITICSQTYLVRFPYPLAFFKSDGELVLT